MKGRINLGIVATTALLVFMSYIAIVAWIVGGEAIGLGQRFIFAFAGVFFVPFATAGIAALVIEFIGEDLK